MSLASPSRPTTRAGMVLDTQVEMITPERVTYRYIVAGPFRRAISYLLDLMLWLAFMAAISILSSLTMPLLGNFSIGLSLIVLFFTQWFYGGFFETIMNGQTPGKVAMKLRVVSVNGVPISPSQAILRNLILPIEGIWVGLGTLPALISMALTTGFRRLGDLAAGTMVIMEEKPEPQPIVVIEEPAVIELADYVRPQQHVSRDLARTLADYVQARPRLGLSRREEMARPLANRLIAEHQLPVDYPADTVLCAVYRAVFMERS